MKYPELLKSEVDTFIEEKIHKLISNITLEREDIIFVNREIMKDGYGVFVHPIYICQVEKICKTEYYDNCEIFTKNDLSLFLYLKGRLLIQRTSTWEIYGITKGLFSKQFELICNYSIKER